MGRVIPGSTERKIAWAGAGGVMVAVTYLALQTEVVTFGRPNRITTGEDFASNTWRAVRALVSGKNIYGTTHVVIPHIGHAQTVSQHVPASLLWQAPFAALPLPWALYAFTFASIIAIWAGVFLLTRPTTPYAILTATACGAFAILIGGGSGALLLGQPTGFILLGLAILVRADRPWLGALGFMLAATTLQTGLPLALALLILNGWPVLWRGAALIAACSVPPVALEVANVGLSGFVTSFISGAASHLGRQSNRIDLGALMRTLGLTNVGMEIAAGIVLTAVSLAWLATLPRSARWIGNPPVLCLVVSFTLLCTYHQFYDMLLVSGAVLPVILVVDLSWPMWPAFGLAAIGTEFTDYDFAVVTICVIGIGLVGAIVARRRGSSMVERSGVPSRSFAIT